MVNQEIDLEIVLKKKLKDMNKDENLCKSLLILFEEYEKKNLNNIEEKGIVRDIVFKKIINLGFTQKQAVEIHLFILNKKLKIYQNRLNNLDN
ncbi:MAG: hypothetical protein ACOCRK_02970 [bacterium]